MSNRHPFRPYETIIAEYDDDGIFYATLNRPEKLNAASDQVIQELNDAFFEFDADDRLLVAILNGNGRAFCSGADVQQRQLRPIEEMKRLGGPAGRGASTNFYRESVNWKPIVAAVHGYAIGSGFGLASNADVLIAAEGTNFQNREVQRGIGGPTGWASTWFWTGSKFANDISLTGRMFSAEEAFAHGLVNRVVPYESLLDTAHEVARQIAENPPLSVRATVRMARYFVHQMIDTSRAYTKARGLHLTEDFRESATAFVEKRKPVYVGR